MPQDPQHAVTRLLGEIGAGRSSAADELLPLVYAELRKLARARMAREGSGSSQPTSLVHEAYLRLVGDREYRFDNRGHFFAAAAEAMRRIVIDRARERDSLKRGGDRKRVTLDESVAAEQAPPEELLALDTALSRLEARDRSMSDVVKLRYFAGLTVDETAQALDISPRTVKRHWAAARAWLYDQMTQR